ncbi:1-aminocyclopropane-1-carboxylate deaminase [Flavobacterium aquatile LMG 4008 = ATCC 11947]|uniref:1-aminocyclopropane-1-carboxylate deaminase n=1 Tax=Flavobacterium aquatile LMG 4008 = ATCC 11947 TaxID=1453498 RepID=A0A095V3Q0_9FLAO|nr:pyridoxal-phosphate dependent enzyme [Flavobacterium aquatile]KGD69500.1 1-aminocyclopropane-1-carboxylate deaminase [Flavobacterium aquatile LMG 4008 = ATCC 11947]OXA66045.1 1-aminocyclopropane-1-carboxylate deaminase [Flavobacterium aquatile LMG 4008 = ATCC 11947]GEC77522.1 1-aminocyclopropane-1-carboxylate deaminase [Flavobacterium aquatile]
MNVITQEIFLKNTSVKLFIRREDLIHPFVSGNKFRKLKYNLLEAENQRKTTLLTFGGAFSNHIAATAFAGKQNGFKTIGIIRGDELASKINENPTLKFAQENGMVFEFVSRETYRLKESDDFIENLKNKFGDIYVIPEGGTNDLAVKGCEEILEEEDSYFDFICSSIGTGGTISGVINSALPHQKVLGFPSLKGDFLQKDIRKFAQKENWTLISDYHFGGYGKVSTELIAFINSFYQENDIPLDPIYTGKMVFGVIDLISQGYFPENSKILMIHTGGLQGIEGMNLKLKSKNLPLIQVYV